MSLVNAETGEVVSLEAYQLFAPLRDEEYEALKADIAKRGVLVPVEVDEHGNVLDGHHRKRACSELGIDFPTVVRGGLSEQEKREHVLKLNLLRRHLGPVSWAEAYERLAQERGINLDEKHNRHTSRDATVASLNRELGVKARTAQHRRNVARKLQEHPDLAEKVDRGEMEVKRAERVIRERAAEEKRSQPVAESTVQGSVVIKHGDFRTVLADIEPGTVDAIITDPPYERDAYFKDSIYADLGELARRVLKPSGVLAVMIGTRLEALDQADGAIGRHMRRRWRAIYLTPGPRWRDNVERVATGYKPVLIFAHPDSNAASLRWINDDVFTSGGDDKGHHHWGQSESGMAALVERLTEPGALVLDPFLGGGTTAVVCRDLSRSFIGCDVDAAAVATARERVA